MEHTVLVTGGAGFIGGHIVERLAADRGTRVIVVDNFDPFYDESIKRAHWQEVVGGCPANRTPVLHRLDIRDEERLDSAIGTGPIDVVVHLAAKTGVRPSVADPADYMDANVTSTARLFSWCARRSIKRVVFASSSSVYGSSTPPFKETDLTSVGAQLSPYAVSKRTGELLANCFTHLYDWRAIGVRIFTAYGPWQRPDLAIHKFMDLMLKGEALPLFGSLSSTRSYTHVSDVVDGIVAAVDWTLASEDSEFEIVNLGTDQSVQLDVLIEELEAVLGITAIREMLDPQSGDVPATCADLAHVQAVLGYEPKVSLREGLQRFANWIRQRRKTVEHITSNS